MKHLVIGGVRSGKSSYAQSLVEQSNKHVYVIVTAEACDTEMDKRIKHHKNNRPSHWHIVEEPMFIEKQLNKLNHSEHIILIDCMTLWLNNLFYYNEQQIDEATTSLLKAIDSLDCELVVVSNEVGLSITPDNELARRFADAQGWLNQALAKRMNRVTMTVAGLPFDIK